MRARRAGSQGGGTRLKIPIKVISATPDSLEAAITEEAQAEMAARLGADSLRYLPLESVARSIGFDPSELCQACLTGHYPTPAGERLYEIALSQTGLGDACRGGSGRTYEAASIK